MYVKCLGSGDAFASGGRMNTCFYLRTRAGGVLLDCGASALIGLRKENLSTDDVDCVLITHLHGDHFGGLPFILCEIIALGRRNKPLTIIGPPKVEARTSQSLECFYAMEIAPGALIRFTEYIAEQPVEVGSLHVIPFAAIHSRETNPHCLRLEEDKQVIAFSGDTQWTDNLLRVSEGADLFLCEASSFQRPARNHMSVKDLLENRSRIHAKRIVLTHVGEEVLRHRDAIPFEIADDGVVLMD